MLFSCVWKQYQQYLSFKELDVVFHHHVVDYAPDYPRFIVHHIVLRLLHVFLPELTRRTFVPFLKGLVIILRIRKAAFFRYLTMVWSVFIRNHSDLLALIYDTILLNPMETFDMNSDR